MILSLFFFTDDVSASHTYIRGVVTKSSAIKKTPGGSDPVRNDTGSAITLYKPEAVEVLREEGSWYRIKFLYSGFLYEGYIPKGNITVKTYTTDDAYEQSLIQMGFPSDYAKKIAILKAIHPKWTFTPSYTGRITGGLDFNTAVSKEAEVVNRNLTNSKNTSLRSTRDGAYNNGVWVTFEGSWYAASEQTIAFYLDPRNFLDESHVFMFENGGYNSLTQTTEQVNKVLNGTFMTNPFECFATSTDCVVGTHYYLDSFMAGARDKNVNPIHMATRVKQEQGVNGSTLSLGKGYNGEYVGYYNFFNIAATGKTAEEIIINGFKHAVNKKWDNQHKSIYDGIGFIGQQYISPGQSTKYYQKFNTINQGYSHQYMQNVSAPYSESYSTYTGYYNSYPNMDAWDQGEYDFLIPVYNNMPEYTTLDATQNSDATLKSMSIEGCKLNPSFQSSAYEYECFTPKETKELTIKAEATNANATVANPGKITLTEDKMTTQITVTAVNGQTAVYVININKIETDGYSPTEILNGIGIKVTENNVSNIGVGSDISNIINSITSKYHFAEIKITEPNGTEIHDGVAKTGQMITLTNAGITSTFKVVIYGDTNGDGLIDIRDLLSVQKHLVKSKLLTEEYLKSADLNKDNALDIRDLLLEQKHLVGAYTINQG